MLLSRVLPTPGGCVRMDGIDVCELPLRSVRSAIGYAQQDAFLFSTTVARNIGFALDEPDGADGLTKIRHAAREAQVLEETLSLPEGFDTVVGERGVQLSGARSNASRSRARWSGNRRSSSWTTRSPPSTPRRRARSWLAIERQAARRTVVLVTHRFAAASRCDRVVVLDVGRIVEHGTHDELVRGGGIYAAFAEEQQMARELEEIGTCRRTIRLPRQRESRRRVRCRQHEPAGE